jgi:uncharacterized protein
VKTKILLSAILFLLFSVQVFGEGVARDRIVDNAGLLNVTEKTDLFNLIEYVVSTYNFDLVIVTEKSIGDASPETYADDFFDTNGYGIGSNRDGCLFLRVTGTKDYYFSTTGRGIKILNQTALNKLKSDVEDFLGKGAPYAAFHAFVLDWDQFLSLEAKGRNYNFFQQWNIVLLIIVWVFALIIGFAVVHSWRRGMNTAMSQAQAAAYVVSGSLNFTEKKESFLYSNTSKTPRSSGGGSSSLVKGAIRTGSSGMRHGGGGGRR